MTKEKQSIIYSRNKKLTLHKKIIMDVLYFDQKSCDFYNRWDTSDWTQTKRKSAMSWRMSLQLPGCVSDTDEDF